MKLEYRLELEHLIQWNLQLLASRIKLQKLGSLLLVNLVAVFLIGAITDFHYPLVPTLVALTASLLLACYLWKNIEIRIRKQLKNSYAAQQSQAKIFGRCMLEIHGDTLIDRTADGANMTQVQAIKKLSCFADFIHIEMKSGRALIIARQAVTMGDFDRLKQRLAQVEIRDE